MLRLPAALLLMCSAAALLACSDLPRYVRAYGPHPTGAIVSARLVS